MHLCPTTNACWSESGKQLKVLSPGDDEKYQVFGSVDYRTGDLIVNQEERKSTVEYISHIEQLLARWPDRPIVLICDNYSVHLAKKVKELERKQFGRFMQVFLPTYSPTLNPIEMLWRQVRRLVTHNYRFETLADLKQAAYCTFQMLAGAPSRVLSIIGGRRLQPAGLPLDKLHKF